MNYKAIILDLDDTTVVHGKDSLPTDKVTNAIARAKEKIHVCIATARTLADALPVMRHLDLSGPCVLTNGTQIFDPHTSSIVHDVLLPVGIVSQIYPLCSANDLEVILYDGQKDFVYTGGEIPENLLSIYIPKISLDKIDDLVTLFSIDTHVHVQKLVAWDKRFMSIDITNSEASKLHGILEIAKILHITTEEIIGVGDGYNDFPLLMACGFKIAMGNAVPELKVIADFIAPSVYEDGVATVIEKFVLQ